MEAAVYIWLILCIIKIWSMQIGFLCLESGLTNHKNAINVALKNATDLFICSFIFYLCSYHLIFGSSHFGFIGEFKIFDATNSSSFDILKMLIFMGFSNTCTTIISGAISERGKFNGYVLICILCAIVIFPPLAHMAWNSDGYLAKIGFIDNAGSLIVHGVGGFISLAYIKVIGVRKNFKSYLHNYSGNDIPLTLMGIIILIIGWFGFNASSTLTFDDRTIKIILNTIVAAIAGGVASIFLSYVLNKKLKLDYIIIGPLAGCVSSCAGTFLFSPEAMFLTAFTSVFFVYFVKLLLYKFNLDDVIDVVSIHLGAGIWGTIAVAFFHPSNKFLEQLFPQIFGIGIVFIWSCVVPYFIILLINKLYPLRVSLVGEERGLNHSEHEAANEIDKIVNTLDFYISSKDYSKTLKFEKFGAIGEIIEKVSFLVKSFEEKIEDSKRKTAIKSAEERINSLNSVTRGFAHELRNPLNLIYNSALILKMTVEEELNPEILKLRPQILAENFQSISKKTHDIVKVSTVIINSGQRIEKFISKIIGHLYIKDSSFALSDICQIVKDANQRVQESWHESWQAEFGDEVKVKLDLEYIDEFVMRSYDLEKALMNILDNSYYSIYQKLIISKDYIPEILVTGKKLDKAYKISILDNGLGIKKEDLSQVFEPFFTTKHTLEGAGIGLTVASEIIKAHAGEMQINSRSGEFTEVSFFLSTQIEKRD